MGKFPSKGMRAMLAEFPDAERIVQLRIFQRDGGMLSVEGPITADEAKTIFGAAVGDQKIKSITATQTGSEAQP
jgi:hypothetical protein